MKGRLLNVRAALLVCLVSTAAFGSVFDIHGFGSRGIAMSGAETADARDFSAVYYNPALLTRSTEFNFGVGFTWMRPITQVAPKDPSRTLDCTYCSPEDVAGVSAGFLFPLAGKVKNHLAIGVGLYLPAGRLVRDFAADPERPSWYLYKGSPERIVAFLGAGVKVTDQLRFGLGVQVLANLVGEGASMKIDLFSKQVRFREIDSHLASHIGPTAGLSFAPTKSLRFGLSYRGEVGLDYAIPARIDLAGIGELAFVVSGTAHYSPHTISGGIAWDITDDFTASLDGTFELWSRAPSPHVQLDVDLSGDTLRGLGLDEALDLNSDRANPGFTDTLTARLGFEYRVSPRFAARFGGVFRPTHVPRQDVPGTNILDATTLGGSLGAMIGFADPLEIFSKDIHLEIAGTFQYLFPRDAEKEPTDPTPSYTYSAQVVGLTAALQYAF